MIFPCKTVLHFSIKSFFCVILPNLKKYTRKTVYSSLVVMCYSLVSVTMNLLPALQFESPNSKNSDLALCTAQCTASQLSMWWHCVLNNLTHDEAVEFSKCLQVYIANNNTTILMPGTHLIMQQITLLPLSLLSLYCVTIQSDNENEFHHQALWQANDALASPYRPYLFVAF